MGKVNFAPTVQTGPVWPLLAWFPTVQLHPGWVPTVCQRRGGLPASGPLGAVMLPATSCWTPRSGNAASCQLVDPSERWCCQLLDPSERWCCQLPAASCWIPRSGDAASCQLPAGGPLGAVMLPAATWWTPRSGDAGSWQLPAAGPLGAVILASFQKLSCIEQWSLEETDEQIV